MLPILDLYKVLVSMDRKLAQKELLLDQVAEGHTQLAELASFIPSLTQ